MTSITPVTRAMIHEFILKEGKSISTKKKKEIVLNYVLTILKIDYDDIELQDTINIVKKNLNSSFFNRYFDKWNSCSRMNDRFLKKNHNWLETHIIFSDAAYKCTLDLQKVANRSSGRPSKDFNFCSDRSKRRKTLELRSSVPSIQLTHAATSSLFNEDNIEAGTLIKEMISTPNRAKKILKKWKNTEHNQTEISPEEALAYIMECNMSVDTYNKTREIALKHGHKLFPSYKKVLVAKKETYPSIMDVTENECSTPLQSLLDKTSSRLLPVINKNNLIISEECNNSETSSDTDDENN